mgnify:CR=1 FL=1
MASIHILYHIYSGKDKYYSDSYVLSLQTYGERITDNGGWKPYAIYSGDGWTLSFRERGVAEIETYIYWGGIACAVERLYPNRGSWLRYRAERLLDIEGCRAISSTSYWLSYSGVIPASFRYDSYLELWRADLAGEKRVILSLAWGGVEYSRFNLRALYTS